MTELMDLSEVNIPLRICRCLRMGRSSMSRRGRKALGVKAERSTFEATINSDGIQHLACLLDSAEIRSLPKKVSSKTRPIRFLLAKVAPNKST